MTSPAARSASDRSSRTGGARAPAPTAMPSGQTVASQDENGLNDKIRDLEKGLAEASQKESEVTQVGGGSLTLQRAWEVLWYRKM